MIEPYRECERAIKNQRELLKKIMEDYDAVENMYHRMVKS